MPGADDKCGKCPICGGKVITYRIKEIPDLSNCTSCGNLFAGLPPANCVSIVERLNQIDAKANELIRRLDELIAQVKSMQPTIAEQLRKGSIA